MRKLKWIMLSVAVASMSFFTSCDKGEENTPSDVSGTYTGTLTVAVITGDEESDATAVLTKNDNVYTLQLKDLKVMGGGIEIGDVDITNIAISDKNELSGGTPQAIDVELPETMGGTEVTVNVALESGLVVNNTLTFALKITEVPVMETVVVGFVGSKK